MGEARRTYDLDLARAARTVSLSSLESSSEELGGRGDEARPEAPDVCGPVAGTDGVSDAERFGDLTGLSGMDVDLGLGRLLALTRETNSLGGPFAKSTWSNSDKRRACRL